MELSACDVGELHRMVDQLRNGDVVVVWKLDRLTARAANVSP